MIVNGEVYIAMLKMIHNIPTSIDLLPVVWRVNTAITTTAAMKISSMRSASKMFRCEMVTKARKTNQTTEAAK